VSALLPAGAEIERAAELVYAVMPPTPQYAWSLLGERLAAEVWVKHENHTPVGSFKLRGGLVYLAALAAGANRLRGVIAATRGNHGQSIALAARRHGLPATIVVPHGNSREKNAAMRGFGATLVEHGDDFQAAFEHAERLAAAESLHLVPSYDRGLVVGIATAGRELFRAVPALDRVYVPIGLGSGICGMLAAREALGLATEVVGVVSAHARAYAASLAENRLVDLPSTTHLADGMAVRTPHPESLAILEQYRIRILEVTDREVAAAMRTLYECTHNVAEGAGAAALAAAEKEREKNAGRRIAVVLTGGNVDRDLFASVLDQTVDLPRGDPA
jgi:threonine dehydratase